MTVSCCNGRELGEHLTYIISYTHIWIHTYIYIYSYITYFSFPNQGLPVKRNSRGQDRQTANLSPAGETAATYSAYIKDLDQLLLDASCTLLTSLLSLSVFFIHVILMIVHFQTQMSLRLELFPNCLEGLLCFLQLEQVCFWTVLHSVHSVFLI